MYTGGHSLELDSRTTEYALESSKCACQSNKIMLDFRSRNVSITLVVYYSELFKVINQFSAIDIF